MQLKNQPIPLLFQPTELVNKIKLKNKVAMAPMTRCRSDDDKHLANQLMADYYKQRSGAGLIISEGIFVSPRAAGYIRVPGIYTQKQVESWQQVTKAVHENDGKIFAQLWHTGRISHPDFHHGALPLAPSAINPHFKSYTYRGNQDTVTPKAMSIAEIKETIKDFQIAAENAMSAGFDGIELHAANGYLFHQFLAACANIREDEYGGSIANRCRFLLETIEAISQVTDIRNVAIRLNPDLDDSFGITKDETTRPTFDYLIEQLNHFPFAFLHLSGFSKSNSPESNTSILATAAHYRKIYNGTLMINRKLDAESAEYAIKNGLTDMVSIGIPFISNPDLVYRYQNQLPLNTPDRSTFYTKGAKGYTDYPFHENNKGSR